MKNYTNTTTDACRDRYRNVGIPKFKFSSIIITFN